MKPGGILCGDDCARTHPDVLWTIDDFCKDLGVPFTVERRIWMIRRPPGARSASALQMNRLRSASAARAPMRLFT